MLKSKTNAKSVPKLSVDATDSPDIFPDSQTIRKGRLKLLQLKKAINSSLESITLTIVMSVITVYVLFADDVRQLISDKTCDDIFFYITSVCLGLFTIEILLSSIAKPRYFLSFFFWLDIISTFSIIFDIGWIADAIFDTGAGQGAAGAAQLTRASRASRVGSRAGRIVRLVRLIRLIRIVKLYKAAQSTLNNPLHQHEEAGEDEDSMIKKAGSGIFSHKSSLNKDILSHEDIKTHEKERTPSRHGIHLTVEHNNYKKNVGVTSPTSIHLLPIKAIEEVSPDQEQNVGDSNPKSKARSKDRDKNKDKEKDKDKDKGNNNSNNQNQIKYKVIEEKNGMVTTEGNNNSEEKKKDAVEIPQETNVGRKLSNLTTKRVITVVMSVLITIPVFTVDLYLSTYTSGESGLRTLWLMNQTGSANAFDFSLRNYIAEHGSLKNPLITIDIQGYKWYTHPTINELDLRESEKTYYNIQGEKGFAIFSNRVDAELNAILSIVRTIFVTLVLAAAALSFSKDANDLVLAPIESMLIKVKRIAANPLAAAQIEEEDALLYEELAKQGKLKNYIKRRDEGNYETNILEKTILKLGALLAIGFGEAGSNIVAQNMSNSGEVDPMIPGKKVMGIFGFCDIRNFTDATEVLQEGVMVFVNEIAEIVHGTINDYSGAANKNIGDAFLLVWKFPDEEVEMDANDHSIRLKQSIKISQTADMAVVSFIKIIAGVLKSKKLDKYRSNEALNQRLPNYSVKMGFGLHVGWAIEGAIGSEYKIDASYLSPNVNMAARLEAATKQFGVPILISGSLYDICTSETKRHLRQIDKVTVKGSNLPIELYTCDVDLTKIKVDKTEKDNSNLSAIEKKKLRVKSRIQRDDLREKAFSERIRISRAFTTDKDIQGLRQTFTKEFYINFKEGFQCYLSGDWNKAKEMFEITSNMIPGYRDGPSCTLLEVMKDSDFKAPPEWKGYRELTEK